MLIAYNHIYIYIEIYLWEIDVSTSSCLLLVAAIKVIPQVISYIPPNVPAKFLYVCGSIASIP